MIEEWRPIEGWEGFYEVSDIGRVRSVYRVLHRNDGTLQTIQSRILSVCLDASGYSAVKLTDRTHGRAMKARVHRLVAMAFVPILPGKPHVNHIDGDKTNARATNLEWVTAAENVHHAWSTGLSVNLPPVSRGEANPSAKLTESDVIDMRRRYANGESLRSISAQYRTARSATARAVLGHTWKHIPMEAAS